MRFVDVEDFGELQRVIDDLPDQVDGIPAAVCETGETYLEFYESQLARPGDEKIIERKVAKRLWRDLQKYLDQRMGRIYWRCRLETETMNWSVVLRYDENGIDRDVMTDRRCVLDKNWRVVQAYCRLYRAPLRAPDQESRHAGAGSSHGTG